jgi:hypothetical protein
MDELVHFILSVVVLRKTTVQWRKKYVVHVGP